MGLDQDKALRTLLQHQVSLVGYTLSIVRDEHLAEDIFQDIAVLILRRRHDLPDQEHFMPWVRTVARNRALKALRSARRRATPLDDDVLELLEEHWRRSDTENQATLVDALRHCISTLAQRARKLLSWRYGENASCIDIAERTNKPLNTIYVSLSRIQRSLADCVRRRRTTEDYGHV